MTYELVAPGRGSLVLHPSRVVRFLGNAWPDPSLRPSCWSDSVLQGLYDAIHAVALTTAGATSLMHEARVDVVTVPNLSEHLSSSDTTAQLSARFAYAAAMKSINNLLLLGDGESWARQKVDFAGLPEMVRTFLQVAAGAADIPMTRLLGQSPSGLSATSGGRHPQRCPTWSRRARIGYPCRCIGMGPELDLRPQLERLDRLILRSEGIDPSALSFAFRPLWQLDAPSKAALALSKAQATQVYAGLGLWPAAVTARLAEAQLVQDGTYPNAQAVFAEAGAAGPASAAPTLDFDPNQPRDKHGQWAATGGGGTQTAGGARATESPKEPDVAVRVRAAVGSSSPAPASLEIRSEGLAPAPDGQERETPATASASENDRIAFAMLRTMLAPFLLASSLRQHTIEAVRGLANNLPGWLTGGPPSDPPPTTRTAGAGSGEAAQSAAARPWPLPVQGGASASFNERAQGPAKPSKPSSGAATQASTKPADAHDPYENQDIPFDRSNLENKIKNYLLKPSHDDNNGKGMFFESNLGFNAGNWQELADQIDFDKSEAVFDTQRTDNYGNVYYNQKIKVVGANGRSMTLNGAFAIQNGRARLTTLLPD